MLMLTLILILIIHKYIKVEDINMKIKNEISNYFNLKF